jgi:putative heme-binding domain-containing protein
MAMLNNPGADVRRQAIAALGAIRAKSAIPRLLPFVNQADTHDDAITALAQIDELAAFDVYMEGLASKNSSLRVQCENALRGLRAQALPLIEARLSTNELPAQALASLKQIYNGDAAAKKSSVFRHKVLEVPPDQYQDFALSHPGDSRRGKKLFHDLQGLGCIRCHRISGEGGDIGPDLTDIRAKHARADIVESVLYPSKQILDGYQQVFFETKDDDEISGIVRSETPGEVTIIDSAGLKHVLDKAKITSRKTSKISLMPEGLQTGLSLVEFSDLIAYVENPNVPAPPAPAIARAHSLKAPNPVLTASQTVPPPVDITGEDLFSPFTSIPSSPPSFSPPSPAPPLPPSPLPPTLSPARALVPPSGPAMPPPLSLPP